MKKFDIYESKKKELQKQNLTPREYERKVRELANRYKV